MNHYIHSENNKEKLIHTYFLALLPFLIFGFYKNGIVLFQNQMIGLKDFFLPLYFYGISILVGFIVSLIRHEKAKENILFCLLLSCTISINTNPYIYPVVLFIFLFLLRFIEAKKKLPFNTLSFVHFGLLLALLFGTYSYLNIAEKLGGFDYNLFDVFLGHSIGGIATTSLLCVLIAFLLFCSQKIYKKPIVIFASLSYFLLIMLVFAITQNMDYLKMGLNGTPYFAFLFFATDFYTALDSRLAMSIYGFLIGIFSAIFSLFLPIYEAPFLAILLVSIFSSLINKIANKKYLHFD